MEDSARYMNMNAAHMQTHIPLDNSSHNMLISLFFRTNAY